MKEKAINQHTLLQMLYAGPAVAIWGKKAQKPYKDISNRLATRSVSRKVSEKERRHHINKAWAKPL